MTPEQKRKFNTVFGGIFLGTGIVAWMLTVYFAVSPNAPAPAPVLSAPSVSLTSCRDALSQLGYQVTLKEPDVTAFEPLSADPKEQLDRASVAALVCKIPMKSFCMGEGCEQPGLTLVLRKPVDRSDAASAVKAKEAAAAAKPSAKTEKSK